MKPVLNIMPQNPVNQILMGNIFPKDRVFLPVQEFLSGDRAGLIIAKKLAKNKEEIFGKDINAYILASVNPHSKNDIVNRLQHAHIRALTKTRTTNAL